MSVYLHTRLGRGLGISTRIGSGSAVFLLLLSLTLWLTMLVLDAMVALAIEVFRLGWREFQLHRINRQARPLAEQRRALVRPLLAQAVTASSRDILAQGLKTHAVYAVGDRFHSGPFPAMGARLAMLYPDQAAEILIVGRYVTAPDASKVSAALKRLGFSGSELRRLFGVRPSANRNATGAPGCSGLAKRAASIRPQ